MKSSDAKGATCNLCQKCDIDQMLSAHMVIKHFCFKSAQFRNTALLAKFIKSMIKNVNLQKNMSDALFRVLHLSSSYGVGIYMDRRNVKDGLIPT